MSLIVDVLPIDERCFQNATRDTYSVFWLQLPPYRQWVWQRHFIVSEKTIQRLTLDYTVNESVRSIILLNRERIDDTRRESHTKQHNLFPIYFVDFTWLNRNRWKMIVAVFSPLYFQLVDCALCCENGSTLHRATYQTAQPSNKIAAMKASASAPCLLYKNSVPFYTEIIRIIKKKLQFPLMMRFTFLE